MKYNMHNEVIICYTKFKLKYLKYFIFNTPFPYLFFVTACYMHCKHT